MIVIYNDSPKIMSKKIRAIIGRYCWKIARDLWIWPKASIRFDLENELKQESDSARIIFLWKDGKKELGYSFKFLGNFDSRQNEFGLFNHFKKFSVKRN